MSVISDSVRSDIIIGFGVGTVGGGDNPSLVSSMPPGVVHGPDDFVLPLCCRAVVTTCLRKVKHHITSSLRVPQLAVPPLTLTVSTRKLSANATVVDGHVNVRASAVMIDDNNDSANIGNLDDILSEILSASSRVATLLDLDLAFGAVDVTDDLSYTSLLSPLSPLPPPITSPPSSAPVVEPI